jgi:hypothetical protein
MLDIKKIAVLTKIIEAKEQCDNLDCNCNEYTEHICAKHQVIKKLNSLIDECTELFRYEEE